MRYLDVCSGISAPTAAWKPLGWQALCFAEIEAAPRAVLSHHYPDVPLVGDFTQIRGDEYGPVDLLVGGTPCQSFSVAGLRGGLADERGNLALEYLRLADRARPRWLVWENVPGVLSIDGGRAFGAILGAMGELGYGWAYRVLDAQHFGVPQRRRRVFVVGYLGDWRRACAVLFERHSLSGDSPPRREKGQAAPTIPSRSSAGGGLGTDFDCDGGLIPFGSIGNAAYAPGVGSMRAKGADCGGGSETLIAHSLRAEGFDAGEDGTGRGTPLVPVAFAQNSRDEVREFGGDGQTVGALAAEAGMKQQCYVAFDCKASGQNGFGVGDVMSTLRSMGHKDSHTNGGGHASVAHGSAVRRLTPRECERLQGFSEQQKSYTILLCRNYSDQQKSRALAALQNRKSPNNVWTADASGWMLSAEAAEDHSSTGHHDHGRPVAVDVLIDLERQEVRLHSAARSSLRAVSADAKSAFRLPTGIDSFARLAALLTHVWALTTPTGRAESQASIMPSIPHWSGSSIALSCGREIEERAADAAESIALANRLSTSTTLPSGFDTQTCASILKTLSCCVAHAIDGFIPERIQSAPSFAVRLTTTQGFTLVPYRKGMMADGPRYKMLGNSMAVPVVRWIGERIATVEHLAAQRLAA